jgi:uncharacterized Zn-binding protein involved in type VI secretion
MGNAARVNHNHTCPKTAHEGGRISEGSDDVETNSLPQARVTDRTRCTGVNKNDLIRTGSATVEVNGLPAARQKDHTTHGGEIAEGSDNVEIGGASVRATAQQLAAAVQLRSQCIVLATRHVNHNHPTDGATAKRNIADVAAGNNASRSEYSETDKDGTVRHGLGGTIPLNRDMLTTMIDLSKDYCPYFVSEIAGGVHSGDKSRHYKGNAFDVDNIETLPVNSHNPLNSDFRQALTDGGATENLGPGDKGHDGHIHGGWPPQ